MNYIKYADEYWEEAKRIDRVIERKRLRLKDAPTNECKVFIEDILSYMKISEELRKIARLLYKKAVEVDND